MTGFLKVAEIPKGRSFGEIALITNAPRSARILCLEDSSFAVLSKEDYIKTFAKIEIQRRSQIMNFFYKIPLFTQWSAVRMKNWIGLA